MTKTQKILSAFQCGEQLTAKQIQSRFGIVSARGAVHSLRQQGFPIYCNKHVDTKGRVTNKYRMGTPKRSVIAAGYAALGRTAFERG